MNSKYAKWKRAGCVTSRSGPNGNGQGYNVFDRRMPAGMVQDNFGPVAKVKKIAEKNAAKGQNSLSSFFNGNNGV